MKRAALLPDRHELDREGGIAKPPQGLRQRPYRSDGLVKRAEAGRYTGVRNPAPYGYEYKDKHLVINRREAAVVRRIFDLYVRRGRGLTAIVELNHEGVPGRKGGQWSRSQIAWMLRSPLYVGKVINRGRAHDGKHTPIIDPEVGEEARRLKERRSVLPPRAHQAQHLLSGLARCGLCDARLRAQWILTSPKRIRGEKRYRAYYHKRLEYGGDRYCRGVHKSADRLEAAVLGKIREVATSPAFQDAAFEEARRLLRTPFPGQWQRWVSVPARGGAGENERRRQPPPVRALSLGG